MNVADAPKFTEVDAARLARELYGLSLSVEPLPSERDRSAPVEIVFP